MKMLTRTDIASIEHIYAVVTPVVNGWALIGETNKIVTVSANTRFESVTATTSGLSAAMKGKSTM